MAKTSTPSIWSSLAPTPLKGFIEIVHEETRILVATSNIVGVTDRGESGCVITPAQHVIGLGGQVGAVYLKSSYNEILELLKQAQ